MQTTEKEAVLKRFMQEFFDFDVLKKMGIYGSDIGRSDYQAQADRVCKFFGMKTVFEYRAREMRAHISYARKRPEGDPFITVFPSIYE